MDDSQRNLRTPQNTTNFSIPEENDEETTKLAPVSVKAGLELTKIFSELTENWRQFQDIEGGEAIAAILKDMTVEEQLERMRHMPMAELINVIRFHLRKMTTLKDENDSLTAQNRELSAALHRVEHRVGKAQVQVFEKMENHIRGVVDDFHTRELELARKNEALETENHSLKEKNGKLEAKIDFLEAKVENFVEKVQKLTEKDSENTGIIDEKERVFGKLAKKFDELTDENFELKEKLEQAKQRVRDVEKEALQEAADAQNLRVMIVKNKEEVWEQARRHEQDLKEQMDAYCANVEHQMQTLRSKCKSDMEDLTKEHRTAMFQKDSQLQKLAGDLEKKAAEVEKYERHLGVMEAQIKGNVKRSLAVNYQEMLNIVSQGPSHIPTPPYSNPLLDLARDLQTENENKENGKKRGVSDRSSCPPSPKRTVGVQVRPQGSSGATGPSKPSGTRRVPPGVTSRLPSTRK